MDGTRVRSRWAAVGAAVAVAIGGGGLLTTSATLDSGERAVYVPITPCRVMDTRPGSDNVGPRSTPIGPTETHSIQVRGVNGNCTIPTDAVGLVMNVAAVLPTANSFLTVFPAGAALPLAANLNWIAGQPPVSNAVTADIAADGRISFYNLAGTVHVTADIVGYYVDHTHDDRYAPKRETLQLSGAGINVLNGDTQTSSGCFTTTAGSYGFLPVDLPRGARILGATVTINDSAGGTGYNLRFLKRSTNADIGPAQTDIAPQINGGAQQGQILRTFTLDGTEIVDANETFTIEVSYGAAGANGLCQATVEYEHPNPS